MNLPRVDFLRMHDNDGHGDQPLLVALISFHVTRHLCTAFALKCFSCVDCTDGGALSAKIQQCNPTEDLCTAVRLRDDGHARVDFSFLVCLASVLAFLSVSVNPPRTPIILVRFFYVSRLLRNVPTVIMKGREAVLPGPGPQHPTFHQQYGSCRLWILGLTPAETMRNMKQVTERRQLVQDTTCISRKGRRILDEPSCLKSSRWTLSASDRRRLALDAAGAFTPRLRLWLPEMQKVHTSAHNGICTRGSRAPGAQLSIRTRRCRTSNS